MIYLWFEELSHLQSAILGRKFLRQSQQELVLVAMCAFLQFFECILQILHGVVSQFEQELDHVICVLLCVHGCFIVSGLNCC